MCGPLCVLLCGSFIGTLAPSADRFAKPARIWRAAQLVPNRRNKRRAAANLPQLGLSWRKMWG
jgi:hypothetical protein